MTSQAVVHAGKDPASAVFHDVPLVAKIHSYLLDWNYGSTGEYEDSAIDLTSSYRLRQASKSCNECFEYWGGLQRLRQSLVKEHNWKAKQEDKLDYALGYRTGPCTVGMLRFACKADADEFMRELAQRNIDLGRRTDALRTKIRNPALEPFKEQEGRTLLEVIQGWII